MALYGKISFKGQYITGTWHKYRKPCSGNTFYCVNRTPSRGQ